MAEESALLWMSWLTPEELITCSALSRRCYEVARSDVVWQRHRDRLCTVCPSLIKYFADGRRGKQKRARFDRIEINTSAKNKPWKRPAGIWNSIMRLTSGHCALVFNMTNSSAQNNNKRLMLFSALLSAVVVDSHDCQPQAHGSPLNRGGYSALFEFEIRQNHLILCFATIDGVAGVFRSLNGHWCGEFPMARLWLRWDQFVRTGRVHYDLVDILLEP